jgi:DNA repair protein RadD
MILRPYQVRILDATWAAMQHKHNVLIVAPCAAGKTVLFSKITQRLLRENSAFRVLILVDREILVTQSRDKLHSIAPELSHEVGIVCSSVTTTKELDRRVTIASRQTLINCMEQFAPVHLCIVDEAHLMSIPREDKPTPDQFAEIVCKLREYNPNMRLVGCTASPYRLGGGYIHGDQNKPGSRPYFDQVDAEVSTKEMLAAGYLAPLVGRANTGSTMQADLKNISIVGGEYNLGQLSSMMCKSTHVQSCISAWREYAWGRKKTLVFCTTIEHSETVAAAFYAAGIPSVAIHSKLTPVEESIRMTALERGTMQVFTSVAKLTTGLDITDLDCGILARPTKSTALYKQIVGRFQRLAEGKTDALIIDLVGATTEFGTDMDNLKVNVPRDASGETPFKICPGENENGTVCGQSVHASLRYCPHCSYAFPVDEAVEAKIGKLEKVKFNDIQEPESYTVSHVSYEVHESRNTGKHLIKVTYQCGQFSKFNEWICLPDFYNGFAVQKARDWWDQRTEEPFPQTCEEFIFLADNLMQPAVVIVVKEGKYDRITDVKFVEHGDVLPEELDDYIPMVSSLEDVPF